MDGLIKKCKYLSSTLSTEILFISGAEKARGLTYKFQEIFNNNLKIVGYEILIENPLSSGVTLFSADDVVELLYIKIINSRELNFLIGKSLFLNLENYELCNFQTLKKIVELNLVLDAHGVCLVVELTERDHCFPCKSFGSGIKYLYENNVTLAADDYNMFISDYRNAFVFKYFNFVKLEVPRLSCGYVDEFVECTELISDKINCLIFERVETTEQFHFILSLGIVNSLFQGFLFNSDFIKIGR